MSLTSAQQRAVFARGNVLVMAGAGTGKTSTLVARCIDCLSGDEPASLNELLVVTFTEAAAAEARERIRGALEAKFTETGAAHWAEQLALFDTAHIGTLHSFCFKLVREHFHQLGLDPQVTVLDEGRARLLASETLNELLEEHYAGKFANSAAVQELIENYGSGRDDAIRRLALRLHGYVQSRADPPAWMEKQTAMFSSTEPTQWREWLIEGVVEWKNLWLPELRAMQDTNPKAKECADVLETLGDSPDGAKIAESVASLVAAKQGVWPPRRKTELSQQLETFFAGVEFLSQLSPSDKADPLKEDWNWSRLPMLALLQFTEQFGARFEERKRAENALDFHELEQFALQLLWTHERKPSAVAEAWRRKIEFVFVDEYQDINEAQDRIISVLSREGVESNRFLVGDVKQSIYRFRLAEPGIFRRYASEWKGEVGRTIALQENFRSRTAILDLANAVFTRLMREEIGGVNYREGAQLIAGLTPEPVVPATETDVEVLFRLTDRRVTSEEDALEDLQAAEIEARHVALRLRELKDAGRLVFDREEQTTRPVEWRDMAVLLRAPANKAEGYAKEFARVGVPLDVARRGFYDAPEVMDLLNLLTLLDNPLQDVPLIAVLRSPLVSLTLDELAAIRLATRGRFWTALVRFATSHSESGDLGAKSKISLFLERYSRWRTLARQGSLSKCLEAILTETHYAEWLRAQERGPQQHANIHRLLGLTEEFDQFQRQGLFRFLRFVEAQREAEAEPEVSAMTVGNAVRLMSIHQSKGLEFPVVVVADLGKNFNRQDLRAEIILDERFGLCPQVRPPQMSARYPSLTHWLAAQRQQRELLGEELRLLYVAITRAREKLILVGTMSRSRWESLPEKWPRITPRAISSASNVADWLRIWMTHHGDSARFMFQELEDAAATMESPLQLESPAESKRLYLDAESFELLRGRLSWKYPFTSATRRAAKTSVTGLRRLADQELESEAERLFLPRTTQSRGRSGKLSAADVGKAYHRFLQHVTLGETASVNALRAEGERLVQQQILSKNEFSVLNFSNLEKFWGSEIGRRISGESANVRRELAFTARFTSAELDSITKRVVAIQATDGFVIVQGIADLVVLLNGEIWLLDFKTDAVTAQEVEERKAFYAPQLQLYALALERIYSRRVSQCWLHFLVCGETLEVAIATVA